MRMDRMEYFKISAVHCKSSIQKQNTEDSIQSRPMYNA